MKHIPMWSDYDILLEEYLAFNQIVSSFDQATPYYVYGVFSQDGIPIYFGKGKNMRAWDHIGEYFSNYNKDSLKHIMLDLATLDNQFPIMHLVKGNLTEIDALNLEKHYIELYGRQKLGGILANVMPGGTYSDLEASIIGGKIGGRTTRSRNVGIFSPDYDRSAQSKLNWKLGLLDNVDFASAGRTGGALSRDLGVGIHAGSKEQRSEWGKIGAAAVQNRSGIFSKEWREQNPEALKAIHGKCREKRQQIGSAVGSLPWWTDGKANKKSILSPGDNWKRGMTKKKKVE